MNFAVDIRRTSSIAAELERERKSLESCYYTVLSVSRGNAFSGSSKQKIIRSLQMILEEMEDEKRKISQMEDCLYQVIQIYSVYEERIAKCETGIDIEWDDGEPSGTPNSPQAEQPTSPQTRYEIGIAKYINEWFQNVILGKPYSWLPIISITSPRTALLYLTGGIAVGKTPSFFTNSRTSSAGAGAEWLAKGTINILDIEITGKVSGYAGAAALIGGLVDIEIGFNEEGWDNFVDFVIFWD